MTSHETELLCSAGRFRPIARQCTCGARWNVDQHGAPQQCPEEDPVIGLSVALFDLVERWTSLPPTERHRVTPAFVPILDALQQRWLAELQHAIDTPDERPPP